MKKSLLTVFVGTVLILASMACALGATPEPTATATTEAPTATEVPATETASPTVIPPTETASPTAEPTTSGPVACMVTGGGADVNIYNRPSPASDVFSPLANAEFPLQVTVKTADGWLGFDPAVAQAANMGVFRYRWINSAQVTTAGGCNSLPVVVGPLPGICYDQPMEDVPVYNTPGTTGGVPLATLHPEQYAALTGKLADGSWYRVDLSVGNSGASGIGWVDGMTINVNGPCDALESVTP